MHSQDNLEIERKFLVKNLPEDIDTYERLNIRQAYISTSPTIRLRDMDGVYIFTFKGSGRMSKTEFEYPLTEDQFDGLWEKIDSSIIEKTRYLIPLDNDYTAELDVYKGELLGFVNVEVEFNSIKDAKDFEPPSWFGDEITGNGAYSNANLAINGLPDRF